MRIFRVQSALISVVAGSVLVVALGAGPTLAQGLASMTARAVLPDIASNAGSAMPPASLSSDVRPPADTPSGPVPPADIPDAGAPVAVTSPVAPAGSAGDGAAAPLQLIDGTSQDAVPTESADANTGGDGAAVPVPADTPVATASLPATGGKPATAADAALTMANMMDGAGGGISNADLMSALESGAAAGQPMALWRLGTMYENGEGVAKDDVKAFGYFSQIANDHADAAPRGVDSDIVAQSFVKMGDYYRHGLPDAGIQADPERAEQLVLHAATYFGNADAQYRVGELYLNSTDDANPLQGARWLALAAHKGHIAAQAKLGDLLFNGAGIKAHPAEGLMWLSIAHDRSIGTADEGWINELLTRDMSVANPTDREQAIKMANSVEPQFGPPDESIPGD